MRKTVREKIRIDNVEIIDIAEGGKGVGKAEDLVLFIQHAIPGDIVDVEIQKKKKSFAEANVLELKKPSLHRTEAFCKHFGVCGGCKWQHMTYDAQLLYKQKSVEDALTRIGKVDTSSIETILPSENTTYYRNKLEYTFSNQRWLTPEEISSNEEFERNALGFHVPLRFDKILTIDHCYLQADPSNAIRNLLSDFAIRKGISFYDLRRHEGALRNLIIRNTSIGELMVIVVFGYPEGDNIKDVMSFLQASFPEITSLLYIVNQKKNDTIFDQDIHVYAGRDHIFEAMAELKFKIGAKSFYQTNSLQAHELYKITKDFAGLNGTELVYDLYTGAGTIANFVAKDARKVTGVEYVPTAIDDAKINAEINGIENTAFFAGDMKDILNDEFIALHGKPDVIITDPPRAGMHPDVVDKLLEIGADRIVYVSCNAATQARDLTVLTQKYEVSRIKPVDMFPHTQHVENVVLLTLKN
ncbi:23S rRNA (uracil(1939)-C(5))-methyltransferase RlmD [Albibacterium bauzanense]|uniref:23S rRNA (Uracil1939-C5)-methyltransferase n=1 Tax=Albibacterium bauzanense TaxID=653929 RepID=A0A4R1LU60_9SPHI|nr:23S rRNA (uracil(1939)-C(5))-methyltransferase RlmD [Albibacterium bauzanense]TCK82888.1 23S rRNA (uracil1939-C5)-methyltransferase [Albibacterium bauzanense]